MTDEPTPDQVPPSVPPPPISYGYPPAAPAPLPPNEERLWAMLAHLSYFVFSIFAPIIIMVVFGPRSAFVQDQAKEALNFHITILIAGIVSGLLLFVGIGLILLPVVVIYGLVFAILAGVKANDGELYRYPLTLRLVS